MSWLARPTRGGPRRRSSPIDRGGRARQTPVRLGLVGTDFVEVEGLSPDDVALAPLDADLTDGKRWRLGAP